MSGFIALFNLDGAPLDPATDLPWLQSATAAMRYRGPDAQATWQEGPIAFGHTLLRSTFEAAHEQQPCTLDGERWLIADARIDDRAALIASLRSHGRTLDDDVADPLLILHAYALWGQAAVAHLLGDFAFVLWDGPARRLFCARDQVGTVPVFYARLGKRLLISNTLDIVRSFPALSQRLDEAALVDFLLTSHYLDADSTIYAAIRRLPPAHQMVVSNGELQISRYWQPPQQVEYIRYRQPQAYVEHFLHLFTEAVSDRLRANHVASALSGGLDSTSIAVMANRLLQQRGGDFEVRGATVTCESLLPDKEGEYAQQVADFAAFTTIRYPIESSFARAPQAEVAHPDPEPWSLNHLWAEPTILQNTAQFARVYFMGFGGDPLLSWARLPWRQALFLGQARSVARDVRSWLRSKQILPKPPVPNLAAHIQTQWSLLAPPLRQGVDLAAIQARFQSFFLERDQRRTMFSAPLWDAIFRVSDPGYSGQAVKVRFPFFDLRLIDYLRRVPPDPWCLNKTLLRHAMIGLLPETVRLRPKTPLGPFPHALWIAKHGIPPWIDELAALPALGQYVDQQQLADRIHSWSPPADGQWHSIFPFLTLANWLRQHKYN